MRILLLSCSLFLLVCNVVGIFQETCVSFQSSSNVFPVVQKGVAAPVFISSDDWAGVQRAASDFVSDIERVTQIKPILSNVSASGSVKHSAKPIIVGTLGKSSLIDQVVNHTKLDVSSIQGLWESFLGKEVANPLPGVDSAYVIIGSDKRGTIFGMYDLSEQFGVSPWYWWADVVPTKHSELFIASSGCSHGPPSVQLRGLFINDEQPALTNWALEKFTNAPGGIGTVPPANGSGSPFQFGFYANFFELILRLKGNYMWPAQWSSMFCVDDPLNQPMADLFGVVMGTSHEEPMMRSVPTEWDLLGDGPWDYSVNAANVYNFWVQGVERAAPFEGLYTIGMRGDGDLPLVGDIQLLEKIIQDQRGIFANVFNTTDVTTIPQVWTLYSEVEGYYEMGLPVPDDVALMWTDDDYGNMRRYPVASERNRTGGAGVYYHVDMVASPSDYKWITSTQLSKASLYEQLSLAIIRNATRVWVLNVGDVKPYEREIEYYMALGWNSSNLNPDNVDKFVTQWAEREFKLDTSEAEKVAEIVANLTRYNARRKPELLNSTTFSLVNYREADRVVTQWDTLANASTEIYNKLSPDLQPSFFELVQHPVLASQTLGKMLIFAGQNNLHASQARLSANNLADQVEALFEKDYDLEVEYHSILGGKWDHMMDQTHVGYYYWQQPMTNTMPAVNRVQSRKQALPGVMRIVPEGSMGAWPGDNMFDCAQQYSCPPPTMTLDSFTPFGNIYIDVGSGGPVSFTWSATSNASWLSLSDTRGSLSPNSPEQRVFVSVPDWSQLPPGSTMAQINFTAVAPNQSDLVVPVFIEAQNTKQNVPSNFTGFVESTGLGVVSFEAAHASRNTSVSGIFWKNLPGLGRTLSGITPWPRDGDNGANFTAGTGPSIEYDFFVLSNRTNITVVTRLSPSLNANGDDRPLGFALQVGSEPIQTSYFIPPDATPGGEPVAWAGRDGFAANVIVSVNMTFNITPGPQTMKLFMIEPAVVVQKFDIDTGNLQYSYLGPTESVFV
ncbi:glycoside hydrolase family 115 protein [Collybiopsis luxurians FD-317 M1]|nr:glycoside hydrolase family 115 protein [Collybiopsis luxurians FD-317 M1]